MLDELEHDFGVLGRRVAVAVGMRRQPEPGIVGGNAADLWTERSDDLAVQEAPVRVAVHGPGARQVPFGDTARCHCVPLRSSNTCACDIAAGIGTCRRLRDGLKTRGRHFDSAPDHHPNPCRATLCKGPSLPSDQGSGGWVGAQERGQLRNGAGGLCGGLLIW